MSKIKAYLDTSVLLNIINNNIDTTKISNIEFFTSIQAVIELCIGGNVGKNVKEIIAFLSEFCKIRSTDSDVLTKFCETFTNLNTVATIENSPHILHLSIAKLEECDFFVTNETIDFNYDIKIVSFEGLIKNNNSDTKSSTLFDLL